MSGDWPYNSVSNLREEEAVVSELLQTLGLLNLVYLVLLGIGFIYALFTLLGQGIGPRSQDRTACFLRRRAVHATADLRSRFRLTRELV